jgi:predicted RNase H-like HicB family nuclease
MSELVFEVTQEEDGGFCAECLTENIFTQGDTWEAVRKNVQEAVRGYYFDQPQAPKRIRLHQKICFARFSLEWLEDTK